MTLLPLLLTASLLVPVSAAPVQHDSARALMQRGIALAAQGDTAAAIAELRAAVDADDGLAEGHFHLGRWLARQASAVDTEDWQERKEALGALREALKLERDNPEYLNEYGWLLIKRNSWNDTERVPARALRPLAREPQRRQELDITPNPTLDYATRERIHIYYEVYGLETDSEGFSGFDVALNITVRALSREGEIWAGDRNPLGILAKLADFWGVQRRGRRPGRAALQPRAAAG